MAINNKREVWQRGPVEGIPALLQPVAHALLQADEEVYTIMAGFPQEKIWEKVAGVASPGFHLLHLTGVLDRLFTYAREASLDDRQLEALAKEGNSSGDTTVENLLTDFSKQVKKALNQLSETEENTLTQVRFVGRARIPSTTIGLLFHAAEHTMRHVGQLLVTVNFLKQMR